MKKNYTTQAINIKNYPLNDNDSIVVMFSKTRGLLHAVAKGVKRPKSKLGARVQMFVANDIMLNEVVSIDHYAFATCYDLNIWLTTDIWEVDDTAFANCNRLHAVVKYGSPAYTSLKKAGVEFDEVH